MEGSYRAVEKADKKIIKEMALTRQFDAIEATYGPKWAAKARGFQERKEEASASPVPTTDVKIDARDKAPPSAAADDALPDPFSGLFPILKRLGPAKRAAATIEAAAEEAEGEGEGEADAPTVGLAAIKIKSQAASTPKAPKAAKASKAEGGEKKDKKVVAPSAYLLWSRASRASFPDNLSFGEIGKAMGTAWKSMSEDDKETWKMQASVAKALMAAGGEAASAEPKAAKPKPAKAAAPKASTLPKPFKAPALTAAPKAKAGSKRTKAEEEGSDASEAEREEGEDEPSKPTSKAKSRSSSGGASHARKRSHHPDDEEGGSDSEGHMTEEDELLIVKDARSAAIAAAEARRAAAGKKLKVAVKAGYVVEAPDAPLEVLPRVQGTFNYKPFTPAVGATAALVLPAFLAWREEAAAGEEGGMVAALLASLDAEGHTTEPASLLSAVPSCPTGALLGTVLSLEPVPADGAEWAGAGAVPRKAGATVKWRLLSLRVSLPFTASGDFFDAGEGEEEGAGGGGAASKAASGHVDVTVLWLPPADAAATDPYVITGAAFSRALAQDLRPGTQVRAMFALPDNPRMGEWLEGRVYDSRARKEHKARGWGRSAHGSLSVLWYEQLADAPDVWTPDYIQTCNSLSPWEVSSERLPFVQEQNVRHFVLDAPALDAPAAVLEYLAAAECAAAFLAPVPKNEPWSAGYYGRIKKPVDFAMMNGRARAGAYDAGKGSDPTALWSDLSTIVRNAKTFNQPDVLPWRQADELAVLVRRLRKVYRGPGAKAAGKGKGGAGAGAGGEQEEARVDSDDDMDGGEGVGEASTLASLHAHFVPIDIDPDEAGELEEEEEETA